MGKQWCSKITAGGDCSHEIKRCLLLGRKVMTNLNRLLKSRDITLSTKVCLVKAMVFPVVMYGCESWTIKKAEGQRIDAFKLWCWWRLFRVPWTASRSNQSILKETITEYSWKDWCWSWNSNTLATWCEELTHLKRPDAGKDWGQEEKQMTEDEMVEWHHQLNGRWVWVNYGSWWWTGKLGVLQSMESQIDTTEWLNWTECTNICALIITNIPYYYKMLMVRGNCVQVCGNS